MAGCSVGNCGVLADYLCFKSHWNFGKEAMNMAQTYFLLILHLPNRQVLFCACLKTGSCTLLQKPVLVLPLHSLFRQNKITVTPHKT